jgi:hypothetical protein
MPRITRIRRIHKDKDGNLLGKLKQGMIQAFTDVVILKCLNRNVTNLLGSKVTRTNEFIRVNP